MTFKESMRVVATVALVVAVMTVEYAALIAISAAVLWVLLELGAPWWVRTITMLVVIWLDLSLILYFTWGKKRLRGKPPIFY